MTEDSTAPAFVCDCDKTFRAACKGELPHGEHDGKRYCVLHFPGIDKAEPFRLALRRKLEARDFNFCGVWFPDVWFFCEDLQHANFIDARFLGAANFQGVRFSDVYFWNATFDGKAVFKHAVFEGAEFLSATFGAAADFSDARFETNGHANTPNPNASFSAVTFTGGASFYKTTFSCGVDFIGAKFMREVDFSGATFKKWASFIESTFRDYVTFKPEDKPASEAFGEHSSVDFQYAKIEKPELVSFHRLTLHPHWFVNVDARKFDFINVKWVGELKEEAQCLRDKAVPSPDHSLSIAYRQLAVNAEEDHLYREASHLRYKSMEAQRLAMKAIRKDAFYWLHWSYRCLSGYGERILQAFVVLFLMLALFALLYTRVGFSQQPPTTLNETVTAPMIEDRVGKPLELARAFTYSLGVMSLQKPEPRPVTDAAQTLVVLETIFGPVQAALLALAIRRRFMVSG